MGGGGNQTSTTVPTIPEEFKPLAKLYTQQATNIAETPFSPYAGNRYQDLTGNQQAGIDMVSGRALGGSPILDQAEASLGGFIGGGANPYLDAMVNRSQQGVADNFNRMTKPQIESAMVGSGSFGNSGYNQLMQNQQEAAARQMGDISTQMYGNAYEGDQARRMAAIGMAPQFGNRGYQDAGQLLSAGGIEQQQLQNNLDFQYQQQQDALSYPFKQLQATGGVMGGNMGSTTTSQGGGGK